MERSLRAVAFQPLLVALVVSQRVVVVDEPSLVHLVSRKGPALEDY